MKRESRTVFIAEDGKEFDNEEQCLQHEYELEQEEKRKTYWIVYNVKDGQQYSGVKSAFIVTDLDRINNENGALGYLVNEFFHRRFGSGVARYKDHFLRVLCLSQVSKEVFKKETARYLDYPIELFPGKAVSGYKLMELNRKQK